MSAVHVGGPVGGCPSFRGIRRSRRRLSAATKGSVKHARGLRESNEYHPRRPGYRGALGSRGQLSEATGEVGATCESPNESVGGRPRRPRGPEPG